MSSLLLDAHGAHALAAHNLDKEQYKKIKKRIRQAVFKGNFEIRYSYYIRPGVVNTLNEEGFDVYDHAQAAHDAMVIGEDLPDKPFGYTISWRQLFNN